jgi:glycosyltransferase involved in cell wall biosynthesis
VRRHRLHPTFDLWRDAAKIQRVVSAETLVAARFEPMLRQVTGFGVLDLTFARGDEIVVVPFVQVDNAMLADPEEPVLIWPASAADSLDDAICDALERKVAPWLLAHFLGRRMIREIVRAYGPPDVVSVFERARAMGFAGAAPYAQVAVSAAPYVYATRLARDKRAIVADTPAGANGVAILARGARTIVADVGGADANAAARAWFGLAAFGAADDGFPYDLAIGRADSAVPSTMWRVELDTMGTGAVSIARPIASDVMISFDVDDSERAGGFAVRGPDPTLRHPIGNVPQPAAGGSGGSILIALRDMAARIGDADGDEAAALADRLRAEGFSVDVRAASGVTEVDCYDLVHVMTLLGVAEVGATAAAAFAAGKPLVATTHLDDVTREGVWGAGMSTGIHRVSIDDERDERLDLFERRKVNAPGLEIEGQEMFVGYTDAVRGALNLCGAVVVSGGAEEAFVRTLGFAGYAGPVGPCLPYGIEPEPIGSIAGPDDFVLVHAPVAQHSNLHLLAAAAMEADLPLLIIGAVADTEYLAMLREVADERVALVPSVTPGQLEALYRRARVFADLSWMDVGGARRARAALAGAALLVAEGHYTTELWRPGLWTADRASRGAIREGLRAAWAGYGGAEARACAGRVASYCDPTLTLTGVVGAYARAQSLT